LFTILLKTERRRKTITYLAKSNPNKERAIKKLGGRGVKGLTIEIASSRKKQTQVSASKGSIGLKVFLESLDNAMKQIARRSWFSGFPVF